MAMIRIEQIEQAIFVIRGQRVMLDMDLARVYGVTTKALNQAVKRNRDRIPADFAYQLTRQEVTDLKSQIVTSSAGAAKLPESVTYLAFVYRCCVSDTGLSRWILNNCIRSIAQIIDTK